MHRAKVFLYVCAGLLCLALAYHFGATSATAQAGSSVAGFTVQANGPFAWVMTPTGDIYRCGIYGDGLDPRYPATLLGNFWSGATPVQQETWGAVKARYRN